MFGSISPKARCLATRRASYLPDPYINEVSQMPLIASTSPFELFNIAAFLIAIAIGWWVLRAFTDKPQ